MTRGPSVYEFKLQLLEVSPPVWRRLQVPEAYSFWDLHVALQDAMGWLDYHLHLFRVAKPDTGAAVLIGIPDEDAFEDDEPILPGWEIPMAAYFPRPGVTVRYEYDFGDGWEHDLTLEAIRPRRRGQRYPVCVDGGRACPPEDCGGVSGYENLLEVLRTPTHEEYESMVQWTGGRFDPEAFDPKRVTFDDPAQRYQLAFGKPSRRRPRGTGGGRGRTVTRTGRDPGRRAASESGRAASASTTGRRMEPRRLATPDVRTLADQLWRGEIDTLAHPPVGGLACPGEEIAPGVLFYKGIASASTIDTGAGLVMLDTGSRADTRPLHEAVRRWRPDTPLAAAVFSHHHVDHIFGVAPFEREADDRAWARPRVYAHAFVRRNFDRYLKTLGWNTAINVRQFQLPPERFRWPAEYRYPDVEFHDRLTFTAGALTFALRHARGETEDAVWAWIPERKILAPGDLFIWAAPNAGNPQKVQRYAGEWAAALREMAALGAELMIPGHGLPVWGADRIASALSDTAELLETIEAQTLALMNQGVTLDRVIHEVKVPARLLDKPYLRPVYDDPQFIVRNVWRLYGGWHDGEPDNLLPAPRAEQAREWIALAGGLEPVLRRASALAAEGNLRLACHLVEFAAMAEPGSPAAHGLRREIYQARAAQQLSSMARNLFAHAARASGEGRRDTAGPGERLP